LIGTSKSILSPPGLEEAATWNSELEEVGDAGGKESVSSGCGKDAKGFDSIEGLG
jgi:hypothetical protein